MFDSFLGKLRGRHWAPPRIGGLRLARRGGDGIRRSRGPYLQNATGVGIDLTRVVERRFRFYLKGHILQVGQGIVDAFRIPFRCGFGGDDDILVAVPGDMEVASSASARASITVQGIRS